MFCGSTDPHGPHEWKDAQGYLWVCNGYPQ